MRKRTVRLNLGAGEVKIPGYKDVDRKDGAEVYPLDAADESVDEIRASHVLEHFSHLEVPRVIADWVRALKPGGLLRIAVPDFETIARAYLAGKPIPTEGYVMGGHIDADDHHGAIFDFESLGDILRGAGLVGITRWTSEAKDCAAKPISLNLQAYKPSGAWPKTGAVMSIPRLGFQDNFFCSIEAILSLGIGIRKHTGAFWGQCLTRAIDEEVEEGAEYILTVDYDSLYTRNDVQSLLSAAVRHPEADAIAALQVHRTKQTPLMTVKGEDGKNVPEVAPDFFAPELTRVNTAHFGLTLIKTKALLETPRPWFWATPDSEGGWGADRTDDDIHFWRQFESAGKQLYLANRVPIGHAELMIRWPGRDMKAFHQHPTEYWDTGKPENVWR
jgi:hypothetical protein